MQINCVFRAVVLAPFALGLMPLTMSASGQQPTLPNVSERDQAGSYVMNFRDAAIRDVAEQVAEVTGRTLILDPSVTGTVTVIAAEPLDKEGVWTLFQSALRVNGYVAVQSGDIWRVVPQASAAQSAAISRGGGQTQDLVTRLVILRNLPADAAQRALRPLVNATGSLEPLTNPNAIIVTDYADNVARVVDLARQIDSGQGSEIALISLRFAAAKDTAAVLERITASADGSTAGVAPRIAVDDRSNTLLVRGTPEAIAELQRVAAALDTPGGAQPVTRVFRLANSDAEFVTEILQGLVGGSGPVTNPVARSLATPSPPMTNLPAALGAEPRAVDGRAFNSSAGQSAPSGYTAGDISIQPAIEINAVVVRASPGALAEMEVLIRELDVRRPQVQIEAAIVEITGDVADALGVQLGLGDAPPRGALAATSFSTTGPSIRNILAALGEPISAGLSPEGLTFGGSDGDGFTILVQALSQSSQANLLSTPSLTTLDNQPAEIVVGQNVPFRTGSFATSGNSRDPFTTIERQDVGITLQVVPRLYDGDVVRLEVAQEVSSLVNSNLAGAADLITNRRSIRTTVLADNGETIVLGGLITDDRLSVDGKVPILGDIPLVGKLFGSERRSRTRRTLFVFLRPTILRTPEDAAAAARKDYDRLRAHDLSPDRQGIFLAAPPPRLLPEIDGVY